MCLFIFPIGSNTCKADNSAKILLASDNPSPKINETLNIQVKLNSPINSTLASMRIEILFDNASLTFKQNQNSVVNKYTLSSYCKRNKAIIVYTNQSGLEIKANEDTCIFELPFKINPSASGKKVEIKCEIKDLYNKNCEEISSNTEALTIIDVPLPDESKAYLKSLSAPNLTLDPSFCPNVFNYTADVPYDTDKLMIAYEPDNLDCSIAVNRTNLNAAGKSTVFKIVVSNKKYHAKVTYQIYVNRAPAPPKEPKSATKSKTSTSQPKEKRAPKQKISKFPNNDDYINFFNLKSVGDEDTSEGENDESVEEEQGDTENKGKDSENDLLEDNQTYVNNPSEIKTITYSPTQTDKNIVKHIIISIFTLTLCILSYMHYIFKSKNLFKDIFSYKF